MFYTIYKITNKINDKIYIGKHVTKNLEDGYMGSGKLIKRAIKKYGPDNFIKEILFICENEADMNNKEKDLVSIGEHSYNLCLGGQGGFNYINSNNLNGTTEGRILGRIKANEVLSSKYGDNWQTKFYHDYKEYRIKGFQNKLKNDIEFRNRIYEKLKRMSIKSLSDDSRNKRLETFKKIAHQKGENNSNYGKFWIKNDELKISKLIKTDEIIPDGWIKGRTLY